MLHKIIVWQCKYCKDIIMSDSREHHQMDQCKCGKCAVDLESYGCRTSFPETESKGIKFLYEKRWNYEQVI